MNEKPSLTVNDCIGSTEKAESKTKGDLAERVTMAGRENVGRGRRGALGWIPAPAYRGFPGIY